MSRIYLTGFGPFPGQPDNPTAKLVNALAGASTVRWTIVGEVLPTSFSVPLERIRPPDHAGLCVHLGVSSQAVRIRLEQQATNRLNARVPDIEGAQPRSGSVNPLVGAQVLRTGLDLASVVDLLNRADLPACLSTDAGQYVCNATYFRSLNASDRAVFVHVPDIGVVDPNGRDWSFKRLKRAVTSILDGILQPS